MQSGKNRFATLDVKTDKKLGTFKSFTYYEDLHNVLFILIPK